jgi:hypothetical protein
MPTPTRARYEGNVMDTVEMDNSDICVVERILLWGHRSCGFRRDRVMITRSQLGPDLRPDVAHVTNKAISTGIHVPNVFFCTNFSNIIFFYPSSPSHQTVYEIQGFIIRIGIRSRVRVWLGLGIGAESSMCIGLSIESRTTVLLISAHLKQL